MFIKRVFDLFFSILGLFFCSPILLFAMLAVWLQDFASPFYIPPRVGKDEKKFFMVKLRSMVVRADSSKVDSTSNSDSRITIVGKIIRRFKLDELMQLWNVFLGDMSLVGPRPNIQRETDLYTDEEKKLLNVKPGITDFSSIVFADEGDILDGSEDPDIDYNQLIRPWKSRLGIFYVENRSLVVDIKLILLTIVVIVNRGNALSKLSRLLESLGADKKLCDISKRNECLVPTPPPGLDEIITSRNI